MHPPFLPGPVTTTISCQLHGHSATPDYHSTFSEKETEAQRSQVTCPRSHRLSWDLKRHHLLSCSWWDPGQVT